MAGSGNFLDLALSRGSSAVIAWGAGRHAPLAVLVRDHTASIELFVIGFTVARRAGSRCQAGSGVTYRQPPGLRMDCSSWSMAVSAAMPRLPDCDAWGQTALARQSSLRRREGSVWGPVWSPDGRRIAFQSAERHVLYVPRSRGWRRSMGIRVLRPQRSRRGSGAFHGLVTDLATDRRHDPFDRCAASPGCSCCRRMARLRRSSWSLEKLRTRPDGDAPGTQQVISGEDCCGTDGLRWAAPPMGDGSSIGARRPTNIRRGSIREVSATGGTSRLLVPNIDSFDLGDSAVISTELQAEMQA